MCKHGVVINRTSPFKFFSSSSLLLLLLSHFSPCYTISFTKFLHGRFSASLAPSSLFSLPSVFLSSSLSAFLPPLADTNKPPSILSEWHHKSINLNNAKHFIPAPIHPSLRPLLLSVFQLLSSSLSTQSYIRFHYCPQPKANAVPSKHFTPMVSLLWVSPLTLLLRNSHS